MVLMNNLETTSDLLKKVDKAAGNSQDKFNKNYGKSLDAAVKDFKHTWEEFYRSLISSDALKVIVQVGTKLVGVLDALVHSSGGVKFSLLLLLPTVILLTKNFKFMALEIAGGDKKIKLLDIVFGSLFGRLTNGVPVLDKLGASFHALGFMLAELAASPTGLIFLGIATAVGVATAAVITHVKHQKDLREENKKLKKSYEDLTTAMKENNKEAIKKASEDPQKAQDELQALMKKREELKKAIANTPHMTGENSNYNADLKETETRINELRKSIKDNNWTLDEATGKIVDLAVASSHIVNLDMANAIKETTEEEINNKDAIIGLYDEYNRLVSIKNKNKTQTKELGHVSEMLSDKVQGLILTKDKEGNVIIENTGLLGKEIGILQTEGVTIEQLTKIKLNEAKEHARVQRGMTTITYEEARKQLLILQEKSRNLQPFADAWKKALPLSGKSSNLWQKDIDFYKEQALDIEKQMARIDSIYTQPSTINTNEVPDFTPDPDETKKSTEATKENTAETDKNREAVNKAKEAVKEYELALKSLELQMTKNDISLGRLYKNSDAYRKKLDEKANLIKQEIALNKQQIATNKELAGSLGAVSSAYVSGMSSSIGEQVVKNAQQYLGRPYKWGGSTPNENFDCSGLVQYVYKQVGVKLNRTTYDQVKQGTPVAKNQLQVGDAVFFGSPSEPHHVGIYMGNGKYIHSPKTGDVVKISNLNSRSDYATARRYVSGSGGYNRVSASNYTGEYSNYINEAAAKYGVSAALIAAVIKQESNFNPNDVSGKGAIGLMQLMPATAKELGVADPYDPKQNIMGGTRELANLIKKYNGNLDLVLAGYNAGVGAVEKFGGVPPYKETKDYIPKVKKYMKGYGGSESSIHSVIDQQMDLIGKSMDMEKKNAELMENLNKINIEKLESHLGEFDDRVKSIDRTITQLRTDVDLAGKNDTTYINYLLKVDEYSNKKLNTLKEKRAFLEKEMGSKIYDETTMQMMREKNSELGSEMLSMLKTIKDLGYEIATARYEAIQQIYKDNIELLNNELERLSTEENKNLKSMIGLRQQMIGQDEENIKRLTNLIKQLNEESYKNNQPFLVDKIEEYTKELDKANTELVQHKKELENVKDTFNSLTESIEDKVKQAIQKVNEEYKKNSEKRRKLFDEAIDKQVEKIEEARRKLDKNETAQNDYEKIMEIQEKINRLDLNDSIEAKKQRAELEKELRNAQKDQRSHELNYEIEERKKRLTNAKDEYGKLSSEYDNKLSESFEDDKLTLEAKQALLNGFIVDLNGNVIDLEKALTTLEDKTGKGLSSTGNKIKKELIDNLHTVQDILKEFGTLDTTKIEFKNKPIANVYGTGVDIENAKKILGIDGYNYVDTKMVDHSKIKLGENDIVLGAKGSHNGINRDDLGGATRLGGSDRYETAAIIQLYKDIQDGKVTPVNGVVYGSGQDLENAMKWLAPLGYKFVDTSKINPSTIRFTQSDLIVGGTGAKNGVSFDVSGVKRLSGNNRFETDKQIEDYAKAQLETRINEAYRQTDKRVGRVYGTGIDLINAKKYLSKQGYDFVDTDSVIDKVLSTNDIVVGGMMKGKENIYNSGAKWLYGKDRHETANLINEFARYNNIRGFSTGGVVDYTGLAMVHGSNNPELVLNNQQVAQLHNFIKGLPNTAYNPNMRRFGNSSVKNISNKNTESNQVYNQYDIKLIVEGNLQGNEREANMFANKIVDIMKRK
ncbi:hypothetical protein CF091_13870 [Clostridium botulinum]